jgi:ATP/maltotriose-dependent transcriptional regulator MalT
MLIQVLLAVHTGAQRERMELEASARTDGEQCFLQTRLVPELGDDGSVVSVLAVSRDISQLKRAEEERLRLYGQLGEREQQPEKLIERLLAVDQEHTRRKERPPFLDQLSPRELEVLGMLAQGWTNREIALRLNLSPGTVKNHVSRLLPKLGAVDRTQAAAQAGELGLANVLGPQRYNGRTDEQQQ